MTKKSLAFWLALLLLFPLAPGGEARAQRASTAAYTVDLTDAGSGEIAVTLEMEAAERPLLLELPDAYGGGLAAGLSSHVFAEEARGASGELLEVRREGDAWSLDYAGSLTFSYKVRIADYRAGTAYLDSLANSGPPWPYFPLLQADLAYLPGYAVFVRPRGSGYLPSLELTMPPGWRNALPWPKQPEHMEELLNNPILAGELSLREAGTLLIALPEAATAAGGGSLAEYGDKARALVEKGESLLGALDRGEGRRLLVALLFRGEGGSAEELFYPAQPFAGSLVIPGPSNGDPLSDATLEATARGAASLLLSSRLRLESDALWLQEGASRYMQGLLPYEAGLWGAGLFWDRFNLRFDAYRAARSRFEGSMAQAGESGSHTEEAAIVLACGGAAACAFIDSELRAVQPPSLDLAAFLRSLFEISQPDRRLSNADITSALTTLTARDWAAFARDFVEGTAEMPPSFFSSLNITEPGRSSIPLEEPDTETSTSAWVFMVIAVLVVFAIPFILEPYALRPRKPGFLERELSKHDD